MTKNFPTTLPLLFLFSFCLNRVYHRLTFRSDRANSPSAAPLIPPDCPLLSQRCISPDCQCRPVSANRLTATAGRRSIFILSLPSRGIPPDYLRRPSANAARLPQPSLSVHTARLPSAHTALLHHTGPSPARQCEQPNGPTPARRWTQPNCR